MDAGALYDIANVDPHPKIDLPIGRYLRIPRSHFALDLHGTTQGTHGADEQDQQAVASCPDDPTTVFSDPGFNELSMVSVELGQGAFIIDADQAAVTGYIRYQDCHKVGVRFGHQPQLALYLGPNAF